MNINRPKTLVGALLVAVISVGSPIVYADSLEAIMQVGKERTKDSRASQNKVDRLADETRDLLADYKTVMKQVDGLRVYNARLERQIANQERRIADIDQSISDAAVIQRQIPPLVTRMLDGLEQFIDLDMPFDIERRKGNTDGAQTRAWNVKEGAWEELPSSEYSAAVRKAVRIAKKQATIELLNMPIAAPEAN